MAELKKAELLVYGSGGSVTKTIACLFNPSEYSIKNGVKYAVKNELGKDTSDIQFIHGESAVMSLSLYFDTTGSLKHKENQWSKESSQKAVTDYTKEIVALTRIDGTLHRPPKVAFHWGNLKFTGVITSLKQDFSYFGVDGKPLRAKLDLEITSTADAAAMKASPLESPDRTKYRTVIQGMTLWGMALEEYGDGEGWKEIARANGLKNPLDIRPGDILRVPARKEQGPGV